MFKTLNGDMGDSERRPKSNALGGVDGRLETEKEKLNKSKTQSLWKIV